MKKISLPVLSVPFALLLLCAFSYGSMATKQGLHMDDWTLMWFIHFLGPDSFIEAFLVDRPLLGGLYAFTASLLGESILAWLLFGIFTRWLSGLAVWLALTGLWPNKHFYSSAAAMLFCVYPGFISLPVAVTYSHHLFILAITFLSLAATNWSLRAGKWFVPIYAISVLLGGYALFSMEYYAGLEMLRPVFIWLILREVRPNEVRRIFRTGLYWAPYLLTILIFAIWRMITPTPRGDITFLDNLLRNPFSTLMEVFTTTLQDIFEASLLAWGQILNIAEFKPVNSANTVKYLLIVMVVSAFTTVYLAALQGSHRDKNHFAKSMKNPGIGLILLGAYALLLGGPPVWFTNLQLQLAFPLDRFTLAMMLGASFLLLGLILFLSRDRWPAFILVGLVAGLAAGFHYRVSHSFYQDWLLQQDFFRQLAWRAPGIQPGTAIFTTELPFAFSSGNSLTAPLNWMYAPENADRRLGYLFYDAAETNPRGADETSNKIHADIRLMSFLGSTSQAIAVVYRPPACLLIINPTRDQFLPDKPRNFDALLLFSDITRIETQPNITTRLPDQFASGEPELNWCYYYQKAELAGQMGDWERISILGDQAGALSKQYSHKNVFEVMPFIEGYARSGQWEQAVSLSKSAYQVWTKMSSSVCDLWKSVLSDSTPNTKDLAAITEMQNRLQCTNP